MRIRVCEAYHVVFYAPFYVAHQQGFFAREGVEVAVHNLGGYAAVRHAMEQHTIDVGIGGIMRSLVGYDRGEALIPVHFARINDRDGFLLLGRKAGFDWPDLLGSRLIVFAEAPTPWSVMRSFLRRKGLDPDAVKVIADVPLGEVARAFRDGAADYALTQAHIAEEMIRDGSAVLVRSMAEETSALPYSSYYCSPDYLSTHAEDLRPFLRAHVAALDWIQRSSGTAVWEAIEPAFRDENPELLRAATERYHALGVWSSDATLPPSSYHALADALHEGELIQRVPPYELICRDDLTREVMAG